MKKGKKLILSLIIITAALLSAFLTAACGCVFFAGDGEIFRFLNLNKIIGEAESVKSD